MGNNCVPRIFFTCGYCGELSSDKPSSFIKKESHFCSQRCYANFCMDFLPKEEQNAYCHGYHPCERKKRRKCRSDLNHAIEQGKITRGVCEVCGELAEAHHDDYSKPLDVKWFCFRHHKIYENAELLTK
jgi:hypothetical protein